MSGWPTGTAVAPPEEEQLAQRSEVMADNSGVVVWPAGGAVLHSWFHLEDKKTSEFQWIMTSVLL